MKAAILSLALLGGAASLAVQDGSKPAPPAQKRTTVVVKAADAKWGDHPFVTGAKLCVQSGDPAKGPSVLMMKFPKGMTVPAHWHTSDETVTVVSGVGVFGTGETVDEAQGTEVRAGSYAVIPGSNPHWAIAKEELVISVALDKPADFNACGEKKK